MSLLTDGIKKFTPTYQFDCFISHLTATNGVAALHVVLQP